MTKPNSPAPAKAQLRSEIRSSFDQRDATEYKAASDSLVENLTDFLTREFPNAFRIATFSALPHEPDLSQIPFRLPEKQFVYPLVLNKTELSFHLVNDLSTLKEGAFGILEPNPQVHPPISPGEIDLILVPGLAFDPHGNRLGHGKGYYDQYLAPIPSTPTIGVTFSSQIVPTIPTEPHDRSVNHLVSEQEVLSF